METQKIHPKIEQSKKVDSLHLELKQRHSEIVFMHDEMIFIDKLLNSYAFQPNTQNLFERIQDYRYRLRKVKQEREKFAAKIDQHENHLGSMLACTDGYCDQLYNQKHVTLKTEIANCVQTFQYLKSEIFNYAGGILKKRKPKE